jgi:hypothetical protein
MVCILHLDCKSQKNSQMWDMYDAATSVSASFSYEKISLHCRQIYRFQISDGNKVDN